MVNYAINTLDLDAEGYRNAGLPFGQEFDGKEFKIYLGPKLNLVLEVFGDDFFEQDLSPSGVDIPATDFVPPLGDERETITEYDIDCEVTKTCLDIPITKVGLMMQIHAGMSGREITMEGTLTKPEPKTEQLKFTSKNDQIIQESMPSRIEMLGDQQYLEYGVGLENVKYYSELNFVPRAMLMAQIDSWIYPLDLSTGWKDLPGVQVDGVVFGAHDNTYQSFDRQELIAVPEFGPITMIVLASALVGILVVKTRHLGLMSSFKK
jgi:hypothetical protein